MSDSTARSTQQRLAELYGTRDHVVWDHFSSEDKDAVAQKIRLLFSNIPEPTSVTVRRENPSLTHAELGKKLAQEVKNVQIENKKIGAARNLIEAALWDQRKWSNGNLLMAIQFVLCVPITKNNPNPLTEALENTTFTSHPILRIRKCVTDNSDTRHCCMVFVDEAGRVYQNWMDYKSNNNLPKGVLIAPYRGYYDFDHNRNVILDVFLSPSAQPGMKALQIADITNASIGIGITAIPATAIFLPVAAPIMITAAMVGGVTALYSVIRASMQIHDRRVHEQSINVTDRESRGHWIGIAGGIVGIGANGLTTGIVQYASRGNQVSKILTVGATSLSATSLVVNATGLGNGIVEMVIKSNGNEDISTLDILQLATSLFLVTHSICNIKSTTAIMNSAEDNTFQSFRASLNNVVNKMFKNISQGINTITPTATIGESATIGDIIRPLNNIPNFTMKVVGDLMLNRRSRRGITNSTGNEEADGAIENLLPESLEILIAESISFILANYRVLESLSLENLITDIFLILRRDVAKKFIDNATNLFERLAGQLQESTGLFIPFEKFLYDLLNVTLKCNNGDLEFTCAAIISKGIDFFEEIVREFYRKLNTRPEGIPPTKCPDCDGYYTCVPL